MTIVLGSTDTPDDSRRYIEVTCSLIASVSEADNQFVMLTIIDVTELETVKAQLSGARSVLDRLSRANEDVITANQQLTETVARLRAENDDLLVAAEEIQAATEEVETLNEELQARNWKPSTRNSRPLSKSSIPRMMTSRIGVSSCRRKRSRAKLGAIASRPCWIRSKTRSWC
jgi:hypothetical protein